MSGTRSGRSPGETGRGGQRRVHLTDRVSDDLRRAIFSGTVAVGQKLPSEASLTTTYGVSRTVVREAVASLRADGLVESRQGSGLYVVANESPGLSTFGSIDRSKISSVIEFLELRAAVEIEAASLASQRRSPAQEEAIFESCETIEHLAAAGSPTADADFDLHLTIADATNNTRFRTFLEMIGPTLIPRQALQSERMQNTLPDYLKQIHREHRTIAEEISRGNEDGAREAMRVHLKGSQLRYRQMLRGT